MATFDGSYNLIEQPFDNETQLDIFTNSIKPTDLTHILGSNVYGNLTNAYIDLSNVQNTNRIILDTSNIATGHFKPSQVYDYGDPTAVPPLKPETFMTQNIPWDEIPPGTIDPLSLIGGAVLAAIINNKSDNYTIYTSNFYITNSNIYNVTTSNIYNITTSNIYTSNFITTSNIYTSNFNTIHTSNLITSNIYHNYTSNFYYTSNFPTFNYYYTSNGVWLSNVSQLVNDANYIPAMDGYYYNIINPTYVISNEIDTTVSFNYMSKTDRFNWNNGPYYFVANSLNQAGFNSDKFLLNTYGIPFSHNSFPNQNTYLNSNIYTSNYTFYTSNTIYVAPSLGVLGSNVLGPINMSSMPTRISISEKIHWTCNLSVVNTFTSNLTTDIFGTQALSGNFLTTTSNFNTTSNYTLIPNYSYVFNNVSVWSSNVLELPVIPWYLYPIPQSNICVALSNVQILQENILNPNPVSAEFYKTINNPFYFKTTGVTFKLHCTSNLWVDGGFVSSNDIYTFGNLQADQNLTVFGDSTTCNLTVSNETVLNGSTYINGPSTFTGDVSLTGNFTEHGTMEVFGPIKAVRFLQGDLDIGAAVQTSLVLGSINTVGLVLEGVNQYIKEFVKPISGGGNFLSGQVPPNYNTLTGAQNSAPADVHPPQPPPSSDHHIQDAIERLEQYAQGKRRGIDNAVQDGIKDINARTNENLGRIDAGGTRAQARINVAGEERLMLIGKMINEEGMKIVNEVANSMGMVVAANNNLIASTEQVKLVEYKETSLRQFERDLAERQNFWFNLVADVTTDLNARENAMKAYLNSSAVLLDDFNQRQAVMKRIINETITNATEREMALTKLAEGFVFQFNDVVGAAGTFQELLNREPPRPPKLQRPPLAFSDYIDMFSEKPEPKVATSSQTNFTSTDGLGTNYDPGGRIAMPNSWIDTRSVRSRATTQPRSANVPSTPAPIPTGVPNVLLGIRSLWARTASPSGNLPIPRPTTAPAPSINTQTEITPASDSDDEPPVNLP